MQQQSTRANTPKFRIGIDLGGTKIAGIILDSRDNVLCEERVESPQHNYKHTIHAVQSLVHDLTKYTPYSIPEDCRVGIGIPGSISPRTGLVQNANSTWLNNNPLQVDLQKVLKRPVKCANDANCFTLSESLDGAAKDAYSVFGVILGTGCGGGLVIDGKLVDGPRGMAGEWGHTPLPWLTKKEYPGRQCWCRRVGCMETWVSGPALSHDHLHHTGHTLTAKQIAELASKDKDAATSLLRHVDRLARGLAQVVNILDPEVIVLGGGLSNMKHLYKQLPKKMAPHIFSSDKTIDIRPPIHGDASGVRGAARLSD